MASLEARVHKLSAEAFSRLKNDHEQFLEAYESEYTPSSRPRDARFCYLAEHFTVCYPSRRVEWVSPTVQCMRRPLKAL